MQHQYYLAVEAKETPLSREDVTFFWTIGAALVICGITYGVLKTTISNLKKQVEDNSKNIEDLEKKIESYKSIFSGEIAKAQSDGAAFIKEFINQKFETLNAVFTNLETKRESDRILFLEKLTGLENKLLSRDETVNVSRREIAELKRDLEITRPVVDHMRQYFGNVDRR